MIDSARFGEVIEASVERLVGECYRLYGTPTLGSLVIAGDDIFAVVEGISTSGLDPTRRIIARGMHVQSEAEIYQENPQITRLLRTEVTLGVIGHRIGGETVQYLPPSPPGIHTFLRRCNEVETQEFFAGPDGGLRLGFLSSMLHSTNPIGDEVIAAVLREAAEFSPLPNEFLRGAGRKLAGLLANDTVRLSAIIERLPLSKGQS